MVIYGNNLHEKLFGIAISKAYIKYATPYCDFVDDPELAPDIDLAVGFNQAINGNPIAANTFTDTLILSGYLFDMSTKEFYRDKMLSNPKVWGDQILKIKLGFETNAFKDALEDCLNSPCNLFAETSDSVARMAQVASTKNGSNSFSVGDLADTFINITNGLDEAVTKKLPAIFGDAALELTQNIKSARSNIVAVVAGKKNLNELTSLANASGTMRGTNKIYRYTPDLKSYTDYTNLGNTILLKTKQTLGGCFERFESAYRYNPFKDNTSVPATKQQQSYNGKTFETEPNGVAKGSPITYKILNGLLEFLGGPTGDGALAPGDTGMLPPLPPQVDEYGNPIDGLSEEDMEVGVGEFDAALSEVDRLDKQRALYGLNDEETDRWIANASEAEKRTEANAIAAVLDAQSEAYAVKAEQSYNRAMDLAGKSGTA